MIPGEINSPSSRNTQVSRKKSTAPHVIAENAWEKTQRYIHKYNTRSSPRYAYAAAQIKSLFLQKPDDSVQWIHHVIHPTTGKACSYKKLVTGTVPGQNSKTWSTALANEFGRLANGVGTRMPTGTNTINFIKRDQVPQDRKITYGNMICDIRPHKAEKHQVRRRGSN